MTLKMKASNSGQSGKRCQNAPSRVIVRRRPVIAPARPAVIVALRVILLVERLKRVWVATSRASSERKITPAKVRRARAVPVWLLLVWWGVGRRRRIAVVVKGKANMFDNGREA
jgi:hypothetical protein